MVKSRIEGYSRPPITEAVIELRIDAEIDVKILEKVVRSLKGTYPHADPIKTITIKIDSTGGDEGVDRETSGYRLTTDEQIDIVLVRPNGISVARLAPYPGWPVLRDCAKEVWQKWFDKAPRHPLARLGIRYINRIDVPTEDRPTIHLEDYLHFHPQNPRVGPRPMQGYVMKINTPTDHSKWSAIMTSALVNPPPLIDHSSFLLDIDVFRTEDIPQKESKLWAVIDEAREVKNQIFEACITDKSRRLFVK